MAMEAAIKEREGGRERLLGDATERELSVTVNERATDLATSSTWKTLLAGGLAGGASKTATAPLSRLTILYQVQETGAISGWGVNERMPLLRAAAKVAREEGVQAFWKGNTAMLMHRVPYSGINFAGYEACERALKEAVPWDTCRKLVAGGFGGALGCTLCYPLDLARTRMAATTRAGSTPGVAESLTRAAREEGILGIFRGWRPTVLQVVPSLACNFALYSFFKERAFAGSESHASTLVAGSLAGIGSSVAVFPLDLARRRMQVRGGSLSHSLGTAFRQGGVPGLYRGILPEVFKVAPGMGLAFLIFEAAKSRL